MDREGSVVSPVDTKKAWREKKKKEEQEGKEEVNKQSGKRKFYPELVEAQKAKPKEQRQNQVEFSPYRTIWQIEGYKSRDEYDKAKEEESVRKLLASVKTS